MYKTFKVAVLFIVKLLGGFKLARKLNARNTCVLCYHGFSYHDEHKFRPKLFMRPETFSKRMLWLKNSDYQVVTLQKAIEERGRKNNFIVLTMDDGWAGTFELANDVLLTHKLPLTLYVTSYYIQKQGIVINVALAYILWKSQGKELILQNKRLNIDTKFYIEASNIDQLIKEIQHIISQLTDLSSRQQVVISIAEQLKVSLYHQGRLLFRLLNEQELAALSMYDINIQLHTHRHCSPKIKELFQNEVQKNISYIQSIIPRIKLTHFCYPSGEHYPQQSPWLKSCGVESATTVSAGMLTKTTDLLKIPRILDGEDVHQLEFEAELCGLSHFFRQVFSR
jgi:peptidoglycan/xylan/chitin deacetylase (PgdA/CDA1 family)